MKTLIKNNLRFIIILIAVIVLGVVGIAFAFNITFNPIGLNVDTGSIEVNVIFDDGTDGILVSDELFPVNEDGIYEYNKDTALNSSVIKIGFTVKPSENNSNPDNVIYDIVLDDIDMSCEIKEKKTKWLLLKYDEDNEEYIAVNEGNFSPDFDTMPNNKLYLTDTQEDLLDTEQEYVLLIWIAENCSNDLTECFEYNQSDYMNRHLNANLNVEIATAPRGEDSKITHNRVTMSGGNMCNYKIINPVPVCKTNLHYTGNEVQLLTNPSGVDVQYTINTTTGIEPGTYNLVAKPITSPFEENGIKYDGYGWTINSDKERLLTCTIQKKEITITTNNQQEDEFTTDIDTAISVGGLSYAFHIERIIIEKEETEMGTFINAINAIIYDEDNNDVTSNFDIIYENAGMIIEE